MPKLRVPGSALPTISEDVPEDRPFEAIIKDLTVADNTDKRGHEFLKAQLELVDADWKGKIVFDNYIPIPTEEEYAAGGRALEVGVRLGRLFAAAKCDSDDTDDLIGRTVQITVKNEEYPEGSGRKVPRVQDYYI